MPRNFKHGKLFSGGSIPDGETSSLTKSRVRDLTSRDFVYGDLVGGGFFGGVDSEFFVSDITADLSIEAAGFQFFGQNIQLNVVLNLTIQAETLTFTGSEILLPKNLNVDSGILDFTGENVELSQSIDLTVDSSALLLTGNNIFVHLESKTFAVTVAEFDTEVNWGYWELGSIGSVSPDNDFKGYEFVLIQSNEPTAGNAISIQFQGTAQPQDLFTTVDIEHAGGTLSLNSIDANYSAGGSQTTWTWTNPPVTPPWDDTDIGLTYDVTFNA